MFVRNTETEKTMAEEIDVFISYSWDSDDHKVWVRELADHLIDDGLDVIIDQYDLNPGDDMHLFMETNVSKAKNIIIICTPIYVKKANDRLGGTGEETSLITSDFYSRHKSGKKYIPIVRCKENDKHVPNYLGSILYCDFCDEGMFATSYDNLIRRIYEEPKLQKPQKGKKPNFTTVK